MWRTPLPGCAGKMVTVLGTILGQMLLIATCLAENIAFNKSADQIGAYAVGRAYKAVDGKYDRIDYYLQVCVHADTFWYGGGPAMWYVDLEDTYVIYNVTVYNTYNEKVYRMMHDFRVDVVGSDNVTRQSCGVYNRTEPVSRGGSHTFDCQNRKGRFVYITKLEGFEDQIYLILCEVEVDGSVQSATTLTAATTKITTATPAEPFPATSGVSTDVTLITMLVTTIDVLKSTATYFMPRTIPSSTTSTMTSTETTTLRRVTLGSLIEIPLKGKPTNQTGVFAGLTSDKAVDGFVYSDRDRQRYCAHPDNSEGQPAEWWIDLGQMYSIHSVTLYNTGNPGGYFRMESFAIRVYSPRIQSAFTCAERIEEVGSAANITLTCARNTYGQYVQFVRLGGRDIHLVTICEVLITGQQYSGCPTGYYGNNCDKSCGICSDSNPDVYNPCDEAGRCINGCLLWWTTDTCQTEIIQPRYTSQQITADIITSDKIVLQVDQVNVPSGLSELYGYEVTYDEKSIRVRHDDTRRQTAVTLTGLEYNTEYNIGIRPYHVTDGNYDYGASYPVRTLKTRCIDPDAPNIISVSTEPYMLDGKHVLKITYQVPEESGCDYLTNLRVYYRRDDETEWTSVNAALTSDVVLVTSIDPNTYKIKMVAINNEGLQAESEVKLLDVKCTSKCSTVLPWTMFAVSFVINVITVTLLLYLLWFIRNKASAVQSGQSQTATRREHPMIVLEETDYENTEMDGRDQESTEDRNRGPGHQYEGLHRQATDYANTSPYEDIQAL